MDVIKFLENLKRKNLEEYEVKQILSSYGIAVPKAQILESVPDRIKLHYPVVAKVSDPSILHKTDVGGVILNIKNKRELNKAVNELKTKFSGSKILLESMERPGVEVIIGVIRDPTFGLAIMFGLGGIYTEIYKDTSIRLVPIEKVDAEEMIEEVKAHKLFEGFRGIEVNKDALVELLLKISSMAEELKEYIEQMDLNPVFVRDTDVIVVDAKMILK